ncbi:MOSC N-terminal beta barrel domain-containing protein [Colwelliaceae bacterium 6471]
MPSIHLSNISIYPIKSSAGINMSTAWIDDLGLSFDRRFVITDTNGLFITARTDPKICLIQANLTANGITLTAPDMPVLVIEYQNFTNTYQAVTVWGDQINAQHCGQQYDQWLSQYLNKPCQLKYFGEQSRRQVKNKTNGVSFADGYPLLLISKASLADLNSRTSVHLTMERFRPNLVVDGCEAFAEDSWQHIRIGEVEFELSKPCSRCIFTTVDPLTAEKQPDQEPLATLKSYRQVLSGDVMFGQNLIQLNQGKITIGDPVTIVSTQQPPVFLPAKKTKAATAKTTETTKQNTIKCINIIDETHDVKTFIFAHQNSAINHYISGQHLPISLTINGKVHHSCYTLSSSPSIDNHLSITVKRVKNGQVSNFLHDHFHVGDTLAVNAPAGNFHLKDKPLDKILLLSAGSGITPMLSMLKTLTHGAEQGLVKNDIVFFHSAHSEQDLIAKELIKDLATRHGNCQVRYTLTRELQSQWQDHQGHINSQMLVNIPDITSRQVFVCGPQGFRESVQTLLRDLGLPDSHYHFESFGQRPATLEQAEQAEQAEQKIVPSSKRKNINILFDTWDKYHQGNNKETILEQGEAAGLILPYSCRGGMCGSCKVKLESGEVKQMATDGLTDAEKQQNYVLACSCIPLTDVVITKA